MVMPGKVLPAGGARFQNRAVPAAPVFRPLYRGDAASVYDWVCPGCGAADHAEEYNDAYEVVVVRRGAFVREVNGSAAFITAGTLMFASVGEVHRIHHPVPGGDACSVFRGSVGTLREMLGEFDPAARELAEPRFPLRHAPLEGREYLLHSVAMRAAVGTDPVEREESALWFLYAALAFASGRQGSASPRPSRGALARAAAAEDIIRRSFQRRLTLAEIGQALECSPFHLSRAVRAATGLSIHRILVRYRLRHALELVLDSMAGLSEVAYATGFSSHSHLTDAFRREYGCTPSRARRSSPAEIRALRRR